MRTECLWLPLALMTVAGQPVLADRGSIPFNPHVSIFEPKQRALIAWNGSEEILILSTDLRASARTKVLEVMPFPSEPTVGKADVAVFKRAVRLINSKLLRRPGIHLVNTRGESSAPAAPAGEVTFHDRIGAHEVSVVRVISGEGFVEWVNSFLRRASIENPVIPEATRSVVEEYIQDGFRWFVFDVVSLDNSFKTTEALQFRFGADWLFYPVKISRANQGQTSIELLILTPRMLGTFKGIPVQQISLPHQPISLTAAEVRSLDKGIDDLLGHREDMKLRIWRVDGDFKELNRDILAR